MDGERKESDRAQEAVVLVRALIRAIVIAALVLGVWAVLRQFEQDEVSLYLLGAAGFIVLAVASFMDRRGSR